MPINDKISKDLIDIEPTAILEFYRLYYDTVNEPDLFYPFHPCSHGITTQIVLNNIAYKPIAVEVEDFETNIFNRISRPRIRVSNVNLAISNLLRQKNDFKNARLERTKIFIKYIDDVNFDGNSNPFGVADPNAEISTDSFIISQKLQENKNIVEFELTAPFDLENFEIPGRLILGRYCYWQYRGLGCNYYGRPVCQSNDAEFTYHPTGNAPLTQGFQYLSADYEWKYNHSYGVGDIVYASTEKDPFKIWYVCNNAHTSNQNNFPGTDGAPWEKDGCSKTIGACKKRFSNLTNVYSGKNTEGTTGVVSGKNEVPFNYGVVQDFTNISYTFAGVDLGDELGNKRFLPFGGFPATDKYQYGQSFKNR